MNWLQQLWWKVFGERCAECNRYYPYTDLIETRLTTGKSVWLCYDCHQAKFNPYSRGK